MPVVANYHTDNNCCHTDNSRNDQRCISSVYHHTENDCNDDEQNGNHSSRCICRTRHLIQCTALRISRLERICYDRSKGCYYQNQGQIRERQEQLLCTAADALCDDLTDRLSFIADRCKQRTEIVNCSKEDTTDQYPEHNRHPTKYSRLNRPVDRTCACDGGKMVTHQHRGLCRYIVISVFQFMCRCGSFRVNSPLLCQPSAVEDVAKHKNHNTHK